MTMTLTLTNKTAAEAQKGGAMAKKDDTTYDLAKDAKIEASIDKPRTFSRRFERKKLMRSDVLVEPGILKNLASRALDVVPRQCQRSSIYLVTDSVTDELYGAEVLDGFLSAGLKAQKLVVESETDESGETSTEETKTLATFMKLADQVLAAGVDKRSCIVSLGGGVVNNIWLLGGVHLPRHYFSPLIDDFYGPSRRGH